MDAKKITEDYQDWHNIAELRLLGLSRSQIAKKLQLPPGRVMRLSRLNVDELLQHGNRPRPSYSCRLDPYEESVKHLLITCPYYSYTNTMNGFLYGISHFLYNHKPHIHYIYIQFALHELSSFYFLNYIYLHCSFFTHICPILKFHQ